MVGGLVNSIPRLVVEQSRVDAVQTALLVSAAGRSRYSAPLEVPVLHLADLPSPDLKWLPDHFAAPDLIVFHSTYIPAHLSLAKQAQKADIPYVISPRGGLSPTAQREKRFKKRLANFFVFRRYVQGAVGLHCLTEGEASSAKAWHRNVFVAGNGTDLPPASVGRQDDGTLRFVFIGRLAVSIKGLDILLRGLELVQDELREKNTEVLLYGPDEDGGKSVLERMISQLGLGDIVSLGGVVGGSQKRKVLQSSDVFLHTSRSEGHPMSVLEALAHSLPCLLTPGTHMAEIVADAGAGWKVDPDPDSIAEGFRRVIRCIPVLDRLGDNARRLAQERYQWNRMAEESLSGYRRLMESER